MTQFYAKYISETFGRLNEAKEISVPSGKKEREFIAIAYTYWLSTTDYIQDMGQWDKEDVKEATKKWKSLVSKTKMRNNDLMKTFEDIMGVMEPGNFAGFIDQDLAIELGELAQEFFEGKRMQGITFEY